MKHLTTFLICLFATQLVMAQQKPKPERAAFRKEQHRCGTQAVKEDLEKQYPQFRKQWLEARKKTMERYVALRQQSQFRVQAVYTIPVVVHVVLPDPTIVTNTQIFSQLNILNNDYAGLNADSSRIPAAFKPFFGKGTIRFCLAQQDLKGDATNGIVRITSSVVSRPGLKDPVKFTCSGGSDAWDPERYMNIWVCQMPSGFLGYTFTPSDPLTIVPLNERGFVNNYRAFGSGGTSQAPFNLGRTATHEIGHFFDLVHIWGPNNCDGTQSCTDDDDVADTPTQFKCTFGAPAADSVIKDQCQPNAPGIMWMNYMDYVDDRAMVMYTPGQYVRMQAAIENTAWMMQLATSNACSPPVTYNRDIRFEQLIDPALGICNNGSSVIYSCSNTYQPIIRIKNIGTDTVKTLSLGARFGLATPVVTSWTGTLPPQASTSITLNSMLLNTGLNSNLSVFTFNPNGAADQNTANDTGKINGIYFPVINLPYAQGFESATFPPDNWELVNPDGDTTWSRTIRASKTGFASMFINNFQYEGYNKQDWIYSPLIPVKGIDSAFVSFSVAAATYSKPDAEGVPTDTLEILLTDDCGTTLKSIYKKWGTSLVTTGNVSVDTGYIPLPSQWRKDSAFLGSYTNTSTEYVRFAFRNTNNYENNVYIDDINIYTKEVNPNLKEKGWLVTPNPFRNKFAIQFYTPPVNLEFISVYNSSGQLVWQKKYATSPGYIEVDLQGRQSGVYFVHFVYRNGQKPVTKLIKIN